MEKITLKEARKIILDGNVVDLQWVTADENRGTGGKRKTEKNLIICGSHHSDKVHGTFTVKNSYKKLANPITIHWDALELINGVEIL